LKQDFDIRISSNLVAGFAPNKTFAAAKSNSFSYSCAMKRQDGIIGLGGTVPMILGRCAAEGQTAPRIGLPARAVAAKADGPFATEGARASHREVMA
jgi:hypothetical protein